MVSSVEYIAVELLVGGDGEAEERCAGACSGAACGMRC